MRTRALALAMAGARAPARPRRGPRRASRRAAAAPPPADMGASPSVVLAPPVGGEAWDAAGVTNAVVRYLPDGLPKNPTDDAGEIPDAWRMWYAGIDGEGRASVGIATSADGVSWERAARPPILAPNEEDWYYCDTASVEVTDVSFQGGVFWMAYDAEDKAGARRVAVALSQDGTNFARYEAEHPSGAMVVAADEMDAMPAPELDVRNPSFDSAWDASGAGGAQQVYAGPSEDLRLYYHAKRADGTFAVGVATSEDGVCWKKVVAEKDGSLLPNARHPCVVPVKNPRTQKLAWAMAYEEPSADGRPAIAVALSDDGIVGWERQGAVLVADGGWDAGGVGRPCLVQMAEGRWRLYYTGKSADGTPSGIGLALGTTEEGAAMPSGFTRRTGRAAA